MAIIDVIKYEGDNQTFVWKHPKEDFNTSSQLIVHESQEAIFFRDGRALDLFGPGRYTLEAENIPILNNLINLPTGGVSAFHCEVYFINKVEQMAIGWGTSSKIQYVDPTYGFPLAVGASGEMSLKIVDSRKILVKLVGTEALLKRSALESYFRMFLQTRVKAHFARAIKERKLSIFEMDAHLDELSDELRELLRPDFMEYGVELCQFMVTTVVRPEEDSSYQRFKDLFFRQYADVKDAQIRQRVAVIDQETDAKKKVIDAQANAAKRATEGYTYQQERGFDVAQRMAGNEAVGEFTNMGIGMGMISGVGAPVAGMVSGAVQGAVGSLADSGQVQGKAPTEQGESDPQQGANGDDPVEALSTLKKLLDAGLIPQEAYDKKMNEILGRL